MKLNLEMADDNVEATQILKEANLSLKDYKKNIFGCGRING